MKQKEAIHHPQVVPGRWLVHKSRQPSILSPWSAKAPAVARCAALALVAVLAALTATVTPAQVRDSDADPSFVVGHVRLDEVFEKSERISAKIAGLQGRYRAGQVELDKQYQSLIQQRESFEDQKRFMSEAGRREASRRLMDALDRYRKDYREQSDKLEREKRAALAPEVEYLWDIVAQIGAERKYDIIFDEADLAYAAPEFDISAEVIRRLDAAPPTPRPAPAAGATEAAE